MGILTVSGNEITDISRKDALSWGTTQQGGSIDQYPAPLGGFGIYESSTNKFRHGQCDSVVDCQAIPGSVVTVDVATRAPFSPQSFKVVTDGTGLTQGVRHVGVSGEAAAAGTVASTGVWFKGVAGQPYRVISRWLNTDTSVTDATLSGIVATGDWQYQAGPAVTVAAGKTGDAILNLVTVDGTRAETFWTSHAMLKGGLGIPTPYIATSGGATAARPGARVQAPASLVNATQGWVASSLKIPYATTNTPPAPRIWAWQDSATNRMLLRYLADGTVRMHSNNSGAVTEATTAASWAADDIVTMIGKWTSSSVGVSFNGGVFTSVAGRTVPTISASNFDIGSGGSIDATIFVNANIQWLACGTGTLTDADAALIASFTSDPILESFPSTARATAAIPFNSTNYIDYPLIPIISGGRR